MSNLFSSITLGTIDAPNRIFMSPLTRARATFEAVPTPLMAQYYAQRATAGLIISEATGISRQGLGWPYAPGIWNKAQVGAWRVITDSVHEKGGRIVCQLWHMGRMVHSSVTGEQPVSSSPTTAPNVAHTYEGKKPYEEARALTEEDFGGILADYGAAAANAMEAGFDGVQIHAANGYLIDQFLRDGTNHRDDAYGGSVENRLRLLREVTDRVVSTIGGERVGVRLSPNGDTQGCDDSNPEAVFVPAAKMLQDQGIAWLELREQNKDGTFGSTDVPKLSPKIREVFLNPLVLNQEYSFEAAQEAISSGKADAIAFGRNFIANPDLVKRFRDGDALAKDDMKTWYSQGPEGYIDYPPVQD